MRYWFASLGCLVAVCALEGCGGDDSKANAATDSGTRDAPLDSTPDAAAAGDTGGTAEGGGLPRCINNCPMGQVCCENVALDGSFGFCFDPKANPTFCPP